MAAGERPAAVIALESAISSIDAGVLRYRGYAIEELAASAGFEDVAWLLLAGEAPSEDERRSLRGWLAAGAALPQALTPLFAAMPGRPAPVPGMLAALPLLPLVEPELSGTDHEHFVRRAALLIGAFTALIGELSAARTYAVRGAAAAEAVTRGGIPALFLLQATGCVAPEEAVEALEQVLILYGDHELNASTFAGRVAASARADLVACVVAALSTLSGALHGGVDRYIRALLAASAEEGAEAVLERYLLARQHVPGFGHTVYLTGDPRARLMRALAERLAPAAGQERVLEVTIAVERAAASRGLPPANVDLYTVAVYRSLGVPDALSPLVFAAGRLAGWCAQFQEQALHNRLIRPRAAYIGRGPRSWPVRTG